MLKLTKFDLVKGPMNFLEVYSSGQQLCDNYFVRWKIWYVKLYKI